MDVQGQVRSLAFGFAPIFALSGLSKDDEVRAGGVGQMERRRD